MTVHQVSGVAAAGSTAGPATAPEEQTGPTREEVLAEAEDYERKAERAGNPATKAAHLAHARMLYSVVALHDQQQAVR